jgi:hypothetical protein
MQEVWGSNPHSSTQVHEHYSNIGAARLGERVALPGSSLHQVSRAEQRLSAPGMSGFPPDLLPVRTDGSSRARRGIRRVLAAPCSGFAGVLRIRA